MAYIGRDISNLSDRVVLDSITASATATYNLTLNSVAYVPSSAESLTVSLNGVIQKPQGSYTVSNATIIFDSALTSSDVIDFIIAERAITLTTVGSGSVGTSQLVDDAVTTAKINDGAITSAKLDSGLALGKIGQVLTTHVDTYVTTTSTTFTAHTDLSVNITPTSTSSKILVLINTTVDAENTGYSGYYTVYRDSTNLNINTQNRGFTTTFSNSGRVITPVHISVLDSPSTTSQVTYSGYFKVSNSGGTIGVSNNTDSTITVMEVLA